jgi:hypothetical protein
MCTALSEMAQGHVQGQSLDTFGSDMEMIRRDPMEAAVIILLTASATIALVAAGSPARRSLTWVALGVGLLGLSVLGFEILFATTQAR